MSIDDLKTKIAPTAPALAAMLDGPVGALAMAALGRSVADDDQASPDAIATAIDKGGDPSLTKVREAEADTFKQLSDSVGGLEQAKLDAGSAGKRLDTLAALEDKADKDREDARARQRDAKDWWVNPMLAILVTLGFFGVILFILLVKTKTDDISAVAQTLLGILGTAWISIITFYFGSSVGSKEKTKLLATQLDNQPT